jgi:hypothetical protein
MTKLTVLAFAAWLPLAACDDAPATHDDDHVVDRIVLEGDQIADLFGPGRTSDPIRTTLGFRRLGLLWDATEDGALEVRTSVDGIVWTAWAAPTVVSVEMLAHAGHADAYDAGDAGSSPDDPLATFYQLRVPQSRALPTFLIVEPLAEIPAVTPEEEVADDGEEQILDLEAKADGSGLKIYTRSEWGARKPRCSSARMTPNRATIHHTVTPTNDSMTAPQRLRQIQSFHMNSRGWCDIGYNFLVSRDGRVWRGRGGRTVGAHVTNSNTGNVGISFMGTYTSTAPTERQMCNTGKLLRRLRSLYPALSLNRTDVKGHRQYGGTVCPGDALYKRIDTILSKARNGC